MFLPDYRLELSVRSLLGSRSRLQDVPKIAQLIESRVHGFLLQRCVEPRFQQIVLPSLWPRRQTTRGGEAEEGAGSVGVGMDMGVGEGGGLDAEGGRSSARELSEEFLARSRAGAWKRESQEGGSTMPGSMP